MFKQKAKYCSIEVHVLLLDKYTRAAYKELQKRQQQQQLTRELKPHHLAQRHIAYIKIIKVLIISPLHKTDIVKYAHIHKSTITNILYSLSHYTNEIIYKYKYSLPFHPFNKTRRGAYGETYYLLNLHHPLVKQFLEYNKFKFNTKPTQGAKQTYQELKESGSSNPYADLAVHLKIQGIKYNYADLWNEFDKAGLIPHTSHIPDTTNDNSGDKSQMQQVPGLSNGKHNS